MGQAHPQKQLAVKVLMTPHSGAVGVVLIGVVMKGVALIRVTLVGIAG